MNKGNKFFIDILLTVLVLCVLVSLLPLLVKIAVGTMIILLFLVPAIILFFPIYLAVSTVTKHFIMKR